MISASDLSFKLPLRHVLLAALHKHLTFKSNFCS